jgi:hypothetical protein
MNWISVFKKMPNKRENLLVLLKSGKPVVAKFDGDFFTEDELLVEDITHWLYIPDIPDKTERLKSFEYIED